MKIYTILMLVSRLEAVKHFLYRQYEIIEDFFNTGAIAKVMNVLQKSHQLLVRAGKNTAYWTGVVVCGMALSTGVLHAFGVPIIEQVHAGFIDSALNIIALIYSIPMWLGYYFFATIAAVMALIMQVALGYPYSDFWTYVDSDTAVGFIDVPVVITGWQLVRDVCNIFFSVILVIIAMASVLKIESYAWKQTLGKFVIMAILINFSRSIAGIFTDVATVIMATFAGAIGESFAVGLLSAFNLTGVSSFIDLDTEGFENASAGSDISQLFIGLAAAMAIAMVSALLFFIITAVLVIRIVMLWFLIILSPIAYIARILPVTKSFSGEWWGMFGKWVSMGPLIAFFLWLSLTILFGGDNPLTVGFNGDFQDNFEISTGQQIEPNTPYASTSAEVIARFIMLVMMFYASWKLIGRSAAGAQGIIGQLPKAGKSALQMPGRAATRLGAMAAKSDNKSIAQLGKLGTIVGSTALQPYRAGSNMWKNWNAGSAAKREEEDIAFKESAADMRSYLEESGMAKRLGLGMVGAGAVSAAAGLSDAKADGKEIAGRYGVGAAGNALRRRLRRGGARSEYESEKAKKEAMEEQMSELEKVNEKTFTDADREAATNELKAAEQADRDIKAERKRLKDGDGTLQLNVQDGNLRPALEGILRDMEKTYSEMSPGKKRDELGARIKDAQSILEGDNSSVADIQSAFGKEKADTAMANYMGAKNESVNDRLRAAKAQNRRISEGEVDNDKKAIIQNRIAELQKAIGDQGKKVTAASAKYGGTLSGPSASVAKAKSDKVAAEKARIPAGADGDDLLEWLYKAKNQNNPALYQAVVEKMQETNNMSKLYDSVAADPDFKAAVASDPDGLSFDDGADGLELLRRYEFAKHMGQAGSAGLAKSLSGSGRQYQYGYAKSREGVVHRGSGSRAGLAKALSVNGSVDDLKKITASSLVRKNQLTGAETIDSTEVEWLKAFQDDLMADPQTFTRTLNASVRRKFKGNAALAKQLRDAGVSQELVSALQAGSHPKSGSKKKKK